MISAMQTTMWMTISTIDILIFSKKFELGMRNHLNVDFGMWNAEFKKVK